MKKLLIAGFIAFFNFSAQAEYVELHVDENASISDIENTINTIFKKFDEKQPIKGVIIEGLEFDALAPLSTTNTALVPTHVKVINIDIVGSDFTKEEREKAIPLVEEKKCITVGKLFIGKIDAIEIFSNGKIKAYSVTCKAKNAIISLLKSNSVSMHVNQ